MKTLPYLDNLIGYLAVDRQLIYNMIGDPLSFKGKKERPTNKLDMVLKSTLEVLTIPKFCQIFSDVRATWYNNVMVFWLSGVQGGL